MKKMDWTVFVLVIVMNITAIQAFDVSKEILKLIENLLHINTEEKQNSKLINLINFIAVWMPNDISDSTKSEKIPTEFESTPDNNVCEPGDESCEDKTRLQIDNKIKQKQQRKTKQILERFLKRRNFNLNPGNSVILGVPQYHEDLPAAEPILPGHTLLRPSKGMLKSAVKFPLKDGAAVYGNLDNVGITFGKTNQRIQYTNFRKANVLLNAIKSAIERSKMNKNENRRPMIIIEIDPSKLGVTNDGALKGLIESQVSEEENNASEISDESHALQLDRENSNVPYGIRRSGKRNKSRFRDRKKDYLRDEDASGTATDSFAGQSDKEINPGNPYTVHKNKYMQNWLWNHEMDGDHMNINPYAPEMHSLGPSGNQLFFGRKWWYFNQDDYKPMRRK